MHLVPRLSRHIRGQSPEFDPIVELRRRHNTLSYFAGVLSYINSDSEIPSSIRSSPSVQIPSPTSNTMATNAEASIVLGSMYNRYNPVIYTNDLTKVIKKKKLFRFEEDANDTPWHVPSPLNLNPARQPLPKFKDYLPKFSRNGPCMVEDHLNDFSNAFHNIGVNNNDTCMRLFVNSIEGKAAADFFHLLAKSFSTWDGLYYWFRSTFEQPQTIVDWFKEYKNLVYQPGESIKSFNLRFTKVFN